MVVGSSQMLVRSVRNEGFFEMWVSEPCSLIWDALENSKGFVSDPLKVRDLGRNKEGKDVVPPFSPTGSRCLSVLFIADSR